MGNSESRQRTSNGADGDASGVQDYYTILEVDENASGEEIKRSFRRLALIHHPDKNHDNVDEATKRFATIQQAYEVLSDEQERAWYDSHRASLAPEPDAETVFEDIRKGAPPPRGRDRGLGVKHILPFFDASNWKGFDDGPDSFFTIYRNLFSRLAHDESLFSSYTVSDYPSFGDSTWPWGIPKTAASKSENSSATAEARKFYNFWISFATEKDFAWSEMWDPRDAPDRMVRRGMERDNKKAREDARREYNDTIRSLVIFIRKRDPRYKSHLARQAEAALAASNPKPKSSGSSTPKQRTSQSQPIFKPQAWQEVDHLAVDENDAEWAEAEGGEDFECVVCRKTFRSEAAWESHARSKKHLKEVERVRKEMLEEDDEFGLGEDDGIGVGEELDGDNGEKEDGEVKEDEDRDNDDDGVVREPQGSRTHSDEESDVDLYARADAMRIDNSKAEVSDNDNIQQTSRRKGKKGSKKALDQPQNKKGSKDRPNGLKEATVDEAIDENIADAAAENVGTDEQKPEISKREKRRAKEAAKKAQEEGSASTTVERCNVCQETFTSRTKLFNHIKDTGHALATEGHGGQRSSKKVGKKGKR